MIVKSFLIILRVRAFKPPNYYDYFQFLNWYTLPWTDSRLFWTPQSEAGW